MWQYCSDAAATVPAAVMSVMHQDARADLKGDAGHTYNIGPWRWNKDYSSSKIGFVYLKDLRKQ